MVSSIYNMQIMNKLISIVVLVLSVAFAQAQCNINRHNTSSDTKWMSCNTSINPNPARGNSHWLLLELDEFKAIGNVYLWNIADPDHLHDGSNQIVIDVSIDGTTWTQAANIFLPIGQSSGLYEGLELAHLSRTTTKYLLITVLSNHGGDCSGLSEIKIETLDFPCLDDHVSINDTPIDPGVYNAGVTLKSGGTVIDEVYLYGQEVVELLPGFSADGTAILKVANKPCDN